MVYKFLNKLFLETWYSKNIIFRIISFLLLPLSIVYLVAFSLRTYFRKTYNFEIPIICIGNIVVGGSGKTSIALAIIKMLPDKKTIVLLKGYKGRLKGTIKVDKTKHSAIDTGDEALLYAKVGVTYICSNRKDAIDTIIKDEKPDLIILDDGLQDSSINKSKSIVAINGRRGFGNKLLLPSGPLRENISSTLKKNYIFLILGKDKTNISSQYNNSFFKADIISEIDGNNREIVAFSGIGDNESFFQTLENYRFNLIKKISFPDHYHFSENEIKTIVDDAAKDGHEIYTTAKDWVRIDQNLKDKIKQFPINLEIKDKEKFIEAILN
jgi:tetraacyldisaccharide 4'-kinase